DDLGRPRHHGLRPARCDGRADRAPGRAGDRHRRRGQHPDEHPGNGHAGAVPPAGEGLHPEQRVHGDGAAVAGAAARRPLLRKLLGGAAGLRQARRQLPRHRPAGEDDRRPGPRDTRDARHRRAGHRRHRGGQGRELLPHDPVRRRTQRDDPRAGAAGRGRRRHRRGQGAGV
ncbi:MAG: Acetolactate synthase large subunit, partial [uncultured Chloroflexia bacterium]